MTLFTRCQKGTGLPGWVTSPCPLFALGIVVGIQNRPEGETVSRVRRGNSSLEKHVGTVAPQVGRRCNVRAGHIKNDSAESAQTGYQKLVKHVATVVDQKS